MALPVQQVRGTSAGFLASIMPRVRKRMLEVVPTPSLPGSMGVGGTGSMLGSDHGEAVLGFPRVHTTSRGSRSPHSTSAGEFHGPQHSLSDWNWPESSVWKECGK